MNFRTQHVVTVLFLVLLVLTVLQVRKLDQDMLHNRHVVCYNSKVLSLQLAGVGDVKPPALPKECQ